MAGSTVRVRTLPFLSIYLSFFSFPTRYEGTSSAYLVSNFARAWGLLTERLVDAAAAARRSANLSFYLYDAQDGVHWRREMDALAACAGSPLWRILANSTADSMHFGAHARTQHLSDATFFLQLASHSWRVRKPADAALLVVPAALGQNFNHLCGKA